MSQSLSSAGLATPGRSATQSSDLTAARAATTRKTVAVLIDYVDHLVGGYETLLRESFEAACRQYDVNLLIVVGRAIENPVAWSATCLSSHQPASIPRGPKTSNSKP